MSEKATIIPVTRGEKPKEIDPIEPFSEKGVIPEHGEPMSIFQGAIYVSFILTFCLAGFAGVVLYRKALKTKVLRFSIGAKALAVAFFAIALNGFFATYLFNNYLNGGDITAPTICGMLVWAFVGPAIALVLNSLLTREESPGKMKVALDAFVYLVIFGCIIASMVPDVENNIALIFSFLGAVFFIIPIARFATALRLAKSHHPEVREVFIQILIYVLLFLPILISALAIANAYALIDSELKLFLLNFVIFNFTLMTGVLMVIAIDYVTQGINLNQPVNMAAQTTKHPDTVSYHETPKSVPDMPAAVSAAASHKATEPSTEGPEPPVVESGNSEQSSNKSSQIPQAQKPVPDKKKLSIPKRPNINPPVPKAKTSSNPEEMPKQPKQPKPPKPPKSSESAARIKAPDKPKKRF